MSLYDRLAETARKQIENKGRLVTIRRKSGSYSPSTDSFAGSSTLDTDVMAAFTAFSTEELKNTNIQASDKKVLIADFQPLMQDILIDGAEQYRIVHIEEIKPGPTAVLWKCAARK